MLQRARELPPARQRVRRTDIARDGAPRVVRDVLLRILHRATDPQPVLCAERHAIPRREREILGRDARARRIARLCALHRDELGLAAIIENLRTDRGRAAGERHRDRERAERG
jgi:hypothetical protein